MEQFETLSMQERLEGDGTFPSESVLGLSSPKISRRTITQKTLVDTPQIILPVPQPTPMEKQLRRELLSIERIYGTAETVSGQNIDRILSAFGFPTFFKLPFLKRVLNTTVSSTSFSHLSIADLQRVELPKDVLLAYWRRHLACVSDPTVRVFELVKDPSRNYIVPSDFEVFIKELLRTHPGLQALRDTPEYQDRYMEAVIARIFYELARCWHSRLTLNDLRRSNFAHIFLSLENTKDVITSPDYFDYMSYYIILCKFCELDTDRDRYISKEDLRRYNNGTLSERMIERIFEVCRFNSNRYIYNPDVLSFQDFVWFILAEEDKTTRQSITLWFKCLDIHDRHYLTPDDLWYWYREMNTKMSLNTNYTIPFEHVFAQLVDMIHPQEPNKITLADITRSGIASPFFNMLFSWQRFLDDERRHPLKLISSSLKDNGKHRTDWYRYASKHWKTVLSIHRRSKQTHHKRHNENVPFDDSKVNEDEHIDNRYLN
jgi:hypothetical protein